MFVRPAYSFCGLEQGMPAKCESVIWSQVRCSSGMAFGEALEALVEQNARPVSVLRRPYVSSAAVRVALLASRQPSLEKYQSSTYSMSSILLTAYSLGWCGTWSVMVVSSLKSM